MRKQGLLMAGIVIPSALLAAGVWAQNKFPSATWPFAGSYEDIVAAPNIHKVLYEDDHVRLVEVTVRPGETEPMHGHPYPSIFARDAPAPAKLTNARLDSNSALNGQGGHDGPAPKGMTWPTCSTMGPQAPHAVTNSDTFPLHFYRLEFKRVDGEGIKTSWKTWYPWMLNALKPVKDVVPGPALGPNFSKDWPYPIAFDSYKAAPNNHQLRFEDPHIRFLEVTIRPGEKENLHGHPYPSVFGADAATLSNGSDSPLDPKSPMNGQNQGLGAAPDGQKYPTCSTMGPQAPHAAKNGGDYPAHFYRIEFKRIDGDGLKTNWKTWYPWMVK